MKKQKLNLSNLKIESFITDLAKENANTVKGGSLGTVGIDTQCCRVYISIEQPDASACRCL